MVEQVKDILRDLGPDVVESCHVDDVDSFASVAKSTRNHYTHPTGAAPAGVPQGRDLLLLAHRLWFVVRACLLTELGFRLMTPRRHFGAPRRATTRSGEHTRVAKDLGPIYAPSRSPGGRVPGRDVRACPRRPVRSAAAMGRVGVAMVPGSAGQLKPHPSWQMVRECEATMAALATEPGMTPRGRAPRAPPVAALPDPQPTSRRLDAPSLHGAGRVRQRTPDPGRNKTFRASFRREV